MSTICDGGKPVVVLPPASRAGFREWGDELCTLYRDATQARVVKARTQKRFRRQGTECASMPNQDQLGLGSSHGDIQECCATHTRICLAEKALSEIVDDRGIKDDDVKLLTLALMNGSNMNVIKALMAKESLDSSHLSPVWTHDGNREGFV